MSLDSLIVNGVNAGVKAWNWTTGRGKADLANTLLVAANIGIFAGHFVREEYGEGAWMASMIAPVSALNIYTNKKVEKEENHAITRESLSFSAEWFKYNSKVGGYIMTLANLGFLAFDYLAPPNEKIRCDKLGHIISDISWLMFGGSMIVMSAENLPPRKNCLSRAKDCVVEYTKKLGESLQPAPQPVPVLNYNKYL